MADLPLLLAAATATAATAAAVIWALCWGLGAPFKKRPRRMTAAEKLTGGSIMEQLVPEITTHVLSYLDCQSLCRLSMTNSAMKRSANDDNAWKALFHKDFTVEQDNITPINGWKSYYAATKKVVSVNAEFFNIIRERSLPAMSRFWLPKDYVKCIHGTDMLYVGYNEVMNRWAMAFNWGQEEGGAGFQVHDIRARVLMDMAWVTMKGYAANMDDGPFHITNIFELDGGQWYMVHHHSSVGFINMGGGAVEIIEAL